MAEFSAGKSQGASRYAPGKAGYNYKAYSKQLVSDAYQQQIYGKYGVVSSITGQLVNGNTDMFSPGVGALQVRRPTLQ